MSIIKPTLIINNATGETLLDRVVGELEECENFPIESVAESVIATIASAVANSTTGVWAVLSEMRNRKINHGRDESPTLRSWASVIEAHILGGDPLVEKAKRDARAHAIVNVCMINTPLRAYAGGLVEVGLAVDAVLLAMGTAATPRDEVFAKLQHLRDRHRFNVTSLPPAVVHETLTEITALLGELPNDNERDEGFSDGVILALQVLNAGGDFMSNHYAEILNAGDEQKLIDRATADDMLVLSGLDKLIALRETGER